MSSYNAAAEYERNRQPDRRYYRLKSNAKRRGLSFNLLKTEFLALICEPCYYCGEADQDACGGHIDRVNNTFGYSLKNVVSCCGSCNNLKGTHSIKYFLTQIHRIAVNTLRKGYSNVE